MEEYSEDDYLMISGIQHFRFCRRQWALIHIEQQWAERRHRNQGPSRGFQKNGNQRGVRCGGISIL